MNMMKKILILSLAFLPLMVYAQYVITGDLYNVPDGEIVLNIRGIDTDSARINKGHFVLRSKNTCLVRTMFHSLHGIANGGLCFGCKMTVSAFNLQ